MTSHQKAAARQMTNQQSQMTNHQMANLHLQSQMTNHQKANLHLQSQMENQQKATPRMAV